MPVDEGNLHPLAYHDATKHDFGRFAPSLGYLDWATQPNPFRRFEGAPVLHLPRAGPVRGGLYDDLLREPALPAQPVSLAAIGALFRFSLGISAWKSYGRARWALRVNPSSGNLHPTEAYLVWGGGVYHYAPDEHVLETRAMHQGEQSGTEGPDHLLIVLTSVHWREAWKYGERAFRYCQHDIGHALGALRHAAALLGWSLAVRPAWSHAQMARLVGIDRDDDYGDAEREEPACVACLVPVGEDSTASEDEPATVLDALSTATWTGRANRLSSSHQPWPLIEEVARATRSPGAPAPAPSSTSASRSSERARPPAAGDLILQRRSATAYDPRGRLRGESLLALLEQLVPQGARWEPRAWTVRVHLVLFVHRVEGLPSGIYAYVREEDGTVGDWRRSMRPEFLWEPMQPERGPQAGLFLLAPVDAGASARRLSCDQDIAADGFFSLAMVADLEAVRAQGPWAYRQLFWECGLIGQVLYLEAESLGARGTGIGCFYDDRVHALLGLTDPRWQSLYHFAAGIPLDDSRLTTEPGYPWEI